MTKLLKGEPVAEAIKKKLLTKVATIKEKGATPKLALIRIGDQLDDIYYEKSIQKTCHEIGIECESLHHPNDINQSALEKSIKSIADSTSIHAILIFFPLPAHLDKNRIRALIPVEKDVDGLNTFTAGALYLGESNTFPPCTAAATLALLKFYNVTIEGKKCVILGRSTVVGKPLAMLLLQKNGTVTICHSHTKAIDKIAKEADILFSATGKAKLVTELFTHPSQIVIDVGINQDPDDPKKYCGDVDFEKVAPLVSAITPAPGGVGNITTAILCHHSLIAFDSQRKDK